MTKLPRDVSGEQLVKLLSQYGYEATRQRGSHVRLINGEHRITIPLHNFLRVGTLNAILTEVATQLAIEKNELIKSLTR